MSTTHDGRPAMVTLQNLGRGWVPVGPGRLTHDDMRQLGLACVQARARYPGPVGDLIEREIGAYRDFGHQFGADGLVPRIVAQLLAEQVTPVPRRRLASHAGPGQSSSESSAAACAAPSVSTGR